MLFSGADLIRTSGQQKERAAKLEIAPQEVKAAAQPAKSALDDETRGALARFARFINKDAKKKPSQNKTPNDGVIHPYIKAQQPLDRWFEVGQNIDIYV